jgi:hypothetical protein
VETGSFLANGFSTGVEIRSAGLEVLDAEARDRSRSKAGAAGAGFAGGGSGVKPNSLASESQFVVGAAGRAGRAAGFGGGVCDTTGACCGLSSLGGGLIPNSETNKSQ